MNKKTMKTVLRMWHMVPKYRVRFYLGFLIGSTSRFYFRYLDSYLLEKFTAICVGGEKAAFAGSLVTVLLMLLFGIVIYPISFGLVYTTYSLISGEVKKRIFSKVMKTKPSYIESQYSGDLVTRITAISTMRFSLWRIRWWDREIRFIAGHGHTELFVFYRGLCNRSVSVYQKCDNHSDGIVYLIPADVFGNLYS